MQKKNKPKCVEEYNKFVIGLINIFTHQFF